MGLRGIRPEDESLLARWMGDPDATKFMETGWRPPTCSDISLVYKAADENDASIFIVEDLQTSRPVGICGLYLIQWICRRAEFRILLGDDEFRGAGLGTDAALLLLEYAFTKLNLETVYLGVNVENKAAVKSYRKAGFVDEGVRRRLIYRNGKYYDVLMMSVLREEWASSNYA